MNTYSLRVCLFLILVLSAFRLSYGEEEEPVQSELIPQIQSVKPGRPFWVAVRLKMKPGWHTYWRNPGESGIATTVKWDLPEGYKAGPLQWPYPDRFVVNDIVNYGYDEEVILVNLIKPPKDEKNPHVTLSAQIRWLACEKICIPGKTNLPLRLPIRTKEPKANKIWNKELADVWKKMPETSQRWHVEASVRNEIFRLKVSPPPSMDGRFKEAEFFPYEYAVIDYKRRQKFSSRKGHFRLDCPISPEADHRLSQLAGVLVYRQIKSGDVVERAVQIDAPIKRK